jgi:transposase
LPEVQNEATVDEISVREGQSYTTVVVDHDSGRLVWAHPDRDGATVRQFLDLLGNERCAQIELVSCDMATWITGPIAERCPGATVCLDPFVRHEALPVRVGCETPPPGCRGSPVKLRAA